MIKVIQGDITTPPNTQNFSLAKWMELMYNTNVRPRSIGLRTVN